MFSAARFAMVMVAFGLVTAAGKATAIDLSRYVLNGFALHQDLRPQAERFRMLEARGHVVATNSETTTRLRFNGAPEAGAIEPDVVLRYSGIVEDGGFTQIEAHGDGRIYRIRHVDKRALDPAEAKAEIIARFGEPTSIQGDMLYWGCSQRNDIECIVADIMPHQIEFRAIDESLHREWGARYESLVSQARSD